MNLGNHLTKSRRWLLVLFATAVLALSAAGVQALPKHIAGLDTLPKLACTGPGPCDDTGGGGG